ncbi:hypothetical protein [Rodentibacter pneumotropicus]|uniref:Uncharacterized protein n=1 Tax=Rodentibacter pneumotropicus TaxID=758 RepID=A0A4S2Q439_9PAST|nr:hypothetical protein [Rodentibacter pneumotropicus]THA11330.1 hypothetical protein D3M78_00500 [Rodentibacter pneumotropicus]
MKLADLPLWVQMCSPTSSQELTELRISLSHNEQLKLALERFLHAQWCVLNSKARKELAEDIRMEYQHAAYAIAEMTGMIFGPDKPKQTTGMLPRV